MNLITTHPASATSPANPPLDRRFPAWGYAGMLLIIAGWFTAWHPGHPISSGSFLLLWLGLIFTLDGLNRWRRGASMLTIAPWKFWQLFLFSTVFWWMFEALNARVQNWHYLLDRPYGFDWTPLSYNIASTLCFSTVLPAVMEMSDLVTSFAPFRPQLGHDAAVPSVPRSWLVTTGLLGVLALVLPLIAPRQAFGLIWLGPLLVLDTINTLVGQRSVIARLRANDWRFLIAIPFATLCCGFFWEMWNYFSLPKWYYTIPYVGFGKIFEMPILGYTGYLPFGLELFAMYQFLLWITRQRQDALAF